MATADLSNTLRTAYRYYWQGMSAKQSWMHLTSPVVLRPEDASLTDQELYGLSIWRDYSATPASQGVKSLSHVTSVSDKEVLVTLKIADVIRNPGILYNIFALEGLLYQYTLSQLFWTLVAACKTTAHPHQGTAAYNSETPLYMVDDFTVTPSEGANTPGGASVSQSNSYTNSFDSDFIAEMINDRAGYFDISGNAVEMDPGMDPARPLIVGAPEYRQKALAIMNQMAPLYDGSGIDYGVKELVDQSGFVSPPAGHMTSGEFALWYRRLEASNEGMTLTGPVAPVKFYGPTVEAVRSSSANHINILGYAGVAVRVSGKVDLDLQWSAP